MAWILHEVYIRPSLASACLLGRHSRAQRSKVPQLVPELLSFGYELYRSLEGDLFPEGQALSFLYSRKVALSFSLLLVSVFLFLDHRLKMGFVIFVSTRCSENMDRLQLWIIGSLGERSPSRSTRGLYSFPPSMLD